MIEYPNGATEPVHGAWRQPVHCGIIPPYLLAALAMCDDPVLAARAVRTLERDGETRRRRFGRPDSAAPVPSGLRSARQPEADPAPQRTVFDAEHGETLPGTQVRDEGAPAVEDTAVNQAYDGLGDTWDLYFQQYQRNSLDDKGLPLIASVHYSHDYDNTYWDDHQMVFGDGDGRIFGPFTASVDVIGHELTHGVTQYTADLRYQDQSGALNESISDVFGVMVKQRVLNQTAEQADWLIGANLLMPGVDGVALRSMKAPGTAYDDPVLGKDPQPATMSGYLRTTADNGGVHTNSGIPNKAFYLAATGIGGDSWSGAGRVWYAVLTGSQIKPGCDFATFAGLTIDAAGELFGAGSAQHAAVRSAWEQVEVLAPAGSGKPPAAPSDPPGPADSSGPSGASVAQTRTAMLTVRRSGGFAGQTLEKTVRLADLPRDDATRWQSLLSGPLQGVVAGAAQPDRFVYQVELAGTESVAPAVAVTLSEQDLSSDVLGLLNRAIRSS
jgi:hypothetical protein